MRISDWSSDVCSSDLARAQARTGRACKGPVEGPRTGSARQPATRSGRRSAARRRAGSACADDIPGVVPTRFLHRDYRRTIQAAGRSEEHTSELQSLMRISYAVFCLKKKKIYTHTMYYYIQ